MPKHSGQKLDAIEKAMERDTFMSPDEAVKFGLLDSVVESHELPAADEVSGETDGKDDVSAVNSRTSEEH